MSTKLISTKAKSRTASSGEGDLTFRISEVSRMLKVSSSTLRQWENAGLTRPNRSGNGYRTYTRAEVDRLKSIQHLRLEKNLNVDAIRHLMGRRATGSDKNGSGHAARPPKIDPIGNRLRKLRRERSMTLSEAATGTGLSVSFLSCLERGQAHASVAALQRLAVFYKTNVLSFFGEAARKTGKLVRPAQRIELSSEPGVRLELLAFGATAMEPHLFRLAPGTSSGGSYHHEGEEFIFVVSGSCDVWLDEVEHYPLREGDSLYFSSSQTHRWSNPYKQPAVLLWINTPPTF